MKGFTAVILRLHQLEELYMLRRIINGDTFDIVHLLKKKISNCFSFYDRDLLTITKYTHARKIIKEKIHSYKMQ